MKKIALLLAIFGMLSSCNGNDDTVEINDELNGIWNLISVTCFCDPVNLETGQHIWEFDMNANKLHVTNNVTEDLHTILETGVYDISATSHTVTIQNIQYEYYFDNEKLFLADDPASDGPIIEFIKD